MSETELDCSYCGCDVTAHDPVYVREGNPKTGSQTAYCNYGCLAAHIEDEGLALGTTCSIGD